MSLMGRWYIIFLLSILQWSVYASDLESAKNIQNVDEYEPVVTQTAQEQDDAKEPKTIAKIIMPKVALSPLDHPKAVSDVTAHSTQVTTSAPIISKSSTVSSVDIEDVSVQDSSAGLDTLNVNSGGNWLEKRIWYQKGETLFELIRTSVQKVTDLRMEFVRNVNHVGHEIDEFYESVNFERGEIDELLSAIDQALQNEVVVRGGDLSSAERSIKQKVQEQKDQFELISKNLQLIVDLDEQIDKTMMKAFKEIDICRGMETRAWNNFKEIGLELDDKRARTLYYEMENFHKNIDQKLSYLHSNLLAYLQNQLISKIVQTISQIKSQVAALDLAGLNLKKLLQKNEQGDFVILQEREKTQEEQAELQAKIKYKKEQENLTWYGKIAKFFMTILHKMHEWVCVVVCSLQYVFCKIKSMICGFFGY